MKSLSSLNIDVTVLKELINDDERVSLSLKTVVNIEVVHVIVYNEKLSSSTKSEIDEIVLLTFSSVELSFSFKFSCDFSFDTLFESI